MRKKRRNAATAGKTKHRALMRQKWKLSDNEIGKPPWVNEFFHNGKQIILPQDTTKQPYQRISSPAPKAGSNEAPTIEISQPFPHISFLFYHKKNYYKILVYMKKAPETGAFSQLQESKNYFDLK